MLLQNAKTIIGVTVKAVDGDIGQVTDLYFDDQDWKVRYLVVDTGGWLSGRAVLIDPGVVERLDGDDRSLRVQLSRERVERSPGIDAARPVSRQREEEYRRYFGWPLYWENASVVSAWAYSGVPIAPAAAEVPEGAPADAPRKAGDPHLRSIKAVTGYYIHASDGDIGHVDDFLIDPEAWTLRYAVVDTRNWLPGKRVLVAWQWLRQISWEDKRVFIDRSKEEVRNSPQWDGAAPVSLEYRIRPA